MRSSLALAVALGVTACGSKNPGNNGDAAPPGDTPGDVIGDPPPPVDAPVDAPPAPATITISGGAREETITAEMPVAGATIAAFSNADETTPLATTTTDSQGNFSLVVQTNNVAVDGFLKASKAGLKDTYLYPAGFIANNLSGVPILMASPASFDALNTLARGNQIAGKGLIAMQVLDAPPPAGLPVAMATVLSIPGATGYRYNGTTGLPDFMATSTFTDGISYMFNVPPNVNVAVFATLTGVNFAAHNMKAWPDALTTTFISP